MRLLLQSGMADRHFGQGNEASAYLLSWVMPGMHQA